MSFEVAVTCKHMIRDIESLLPIFEEHGLTARPIEFEGQALGGDELVRAMDGLVGVIAGDDQFTEEVLEQLPDLKAISKWGIGIDGIDLEAASRLGIFVDNTPGVFGNEVAEIAIGYLIALVRGIVTTDGLVRRGEWPKIVGRSLSSLTVTVVGLGDIGTQVAVKTKALGMNVRGVDPDPGRQSNAREFGIRTEELDDLLADTDALIVTVPLTPNTLHLIDYDTLTRMPAGSWLVNVSRGPVVEEAGVVRALETDHLAGAALDVFEVEPLPQDSKLLGFPNVILGSHNASNTFEACQRTHAASIRNLANRLGVAP